MIKSVTIYCASSTKIDRKYFEGARAIAKILCRAKINVVFGGGATGLMGEVATTVLDNGGHITGIMPHFMKEVEWQHQGVKDFQFVDDMHERKKRFLLDADALIALPGGTGTLEELFEAITLKKLGKYNHPIIIFNQDGFYDPILNMMDFLIKERFMGSHHINVWTVIREPEELLSAIENAPKWGEDAIETAHA